MRLYFVPRISAPVTEKIATAIMNKPASTNNPTRSSAQVNCLRCAIELPPQKSALRKMLFRRSQKCFQIFVRRMQYLVRRTFEINFAAAKHQDVGRRNRGTLRTGLLRALLGTLAGRGLGSADLVRAVSHDVSRCFVETKVCQAESVLNALGGEERSHALRIAPAQDQRDDGLASHRIESGGRRIVKDQRRAIHQRARDGNAPPHPA